MPPIPDSATNDELVFALVGPIGTPLDRVETHLSIQLAHCNYRRYPIKLTDLMQGLPKRPWKDLGKFVGYKRYDEFMTAGNKLREFLERGDALSMLGVAAIRQHRRTEKRGGSVTNTRRAFILRSLKTHDEIVSLRQLYGPALILIAAYCPPYQRLKNIASRICNDQHQFHLKEAYPEAQLLMNRDESESDVTFGQNVRKVFPKADFFVDASREKTLDESLRRIVELILGNTFRSPTRDEVGMFHAYAAALRSSSLQRQVGAAIGNRDGDIVAVGTNEVPRSGGGPYWPEDSDDSRDFVHGVEINDVLKRRMLSDIIKRLGEAKWLSRNRSRQSVESLTDELLKFGIIKDAQVMNILEFGRCVHAEMAALMEAARRGVAVRGCTIYSTTFPCHECTRHIVAAGIKRVVYVEPYPKSLAPELYPDSVAIDDPRRRAMKFVLNRL